MMIPAKSELLTLCPQCEGQSRLEGVNSYGEPRSQPCERCDEVGYVDVPNGPCPFLPGTPEKVIWLAARSRRGEVMHRDDDAGVQSIRDLIFDSFRVDATTHRCDLLEVSDEPTEEEDEDDESDD